ncbi:conserved hypothetical protein [Neospora caninum Liverpool]|uniref:Uncharacterized protein n=1 Tax=Neospora caninum (strain Liverpool) TaxID=572307 RepID=F0VR39_NEOCL|nr:conserved hypothetical protein [Neospora caninum Liverpool]CBZ56186.1 conserved hypothetical protein [Neospora caninum Liverpool]CEL70946.1 TPA: hypothetical protein BN1204_066120 [Neospora caninum Liverpool]|eukprot:XP_003886212.1 conserved hypothetical protein [Neospora caninum Liverpool]
MGKPEMPIEERLSTPTGLYADPRFHLFVDKVSRSSSFELLCKCGEQREDRTCPFCSDGAWTKAPLADPEGDELEELARSFRWLQLTNGSPSLVKKRGQARPEEEAAPGASFPGVSGASREPLAPGVCTFKPSGGAGEGGSSSSGCFPLLRKCETSARKEGEGSPPRPAFAARRAPNEDAQQFEVEAAVSGAPAAHTVSNRSASSFVQRKKQAVPKAVCALETQQTAEGERRHAGGAPSRKAHAPGRASTETRGTWSETAIIPTTVR